MMTDEEQQYAKVSLTPAQIDCLTQIIRGAAKHNPIWDGQIIGSTVGRELQDMGLVHHAHGYWFPSYDGRQVWRKIVKVVQDKHKVIAEEVK